MLLRISTQDDAAIVDELISERFGSRVDYGCLKDLNGRYFLCFHNDTLVAMSGLNKSNYYKGYEIDWTCTKTGYEHKGYMDHIFSTMLAGVKDEDVYCSAFKEHIKAEPNLYYLLRKYGFIKVVESRIAYDTKYMKCKENFDCKFYKGDGCSCREDLYVRYAK